MKSPQINILLSVCMLMIMSLACNLPGLKEEELEPSKLISVRVVPPVNDDQLSTVVAVEFRKRMGDTGFSITCTYPDENGNYISKPVDTSIPGESVQITINTKKPGTYNVSCQDSNSTSAAAVFTVEKPDEPDKPAEPAEGGSFQSTKPGDFNSAGMWMYFDKGSSTDIAKYPVPQQCLPGDNYTHAGGTSSFEIDSAGNMVGACYLTYYNGQTRLNGTMTGTWNGSTGEITFRLETVTESDAEVNGQTGLFRNVTIYTGTAKFNSAVQASGIAQWHTEYTSSNVKATMCFNETYGASLTANGTVPFVINFNPK